MTTDSICLLNGVFKPQISGGAENYVHRVAKTLQARGYDVSIITSKPYEGWQSLTPQRELFDGIDIYRFYPLNHSHRTEETGKTIVGKALWHAIDTVNPHAKRAVAKILDEVDPDIVHTNNFMGISTSVGQAVQEHDATYVHMLHDYSAICPKTSLIRERTRPGDQIGVCHSLPVPCRIYARAKRNAIGQPDHIITPSKHVLSVHREHGFFTDIPATGIRHGVTDISDCPSNSVERDAVLYTGKLQRSKGLETLFEAAERLPDITVHICGSGPMDAICERKGREQANIEYHGYVSVERLRELRRSVSAAVVPSVWMENSPLVIYESFARGLPVVASDIGGIPELVEHNQRGMLFRPGDVSALADAIERITTHSNYRVFQQNALRWARDHTIDRSVDQLLDIYEQEST